MKSFVWMFVVAAATLLGFQAGQLTAVKPQLVLSIPAESGDPKDAFLEPLPDLTPPQERLLNIAYQTAEKDGLAYPQLLQGILLQETRAGQMSSYKVAGPAGHHYYGVCQIKLDAAKDVLARYPELWTAYGFHTHADEEVVGKLIENDHFNIAVASKYLLILRQSGYNSPRSLAVAYNRGPGGAIGVNTSTDPYSRGVTGHIHRIGADRGTYHVQEGDSLIRIAMGLKLNAPLDKVMDAVYLANPKAFIDGDRDLLRADVDLVIPRAAT
jgi:hypothetical protein